jgi:hypothetical protein
VGAVVGLQPLLLRYCLWLAATRLRDGVLTQFMKLRHLRRFHTWL